MSETIAPPATTAPEEELDSDLEKKLAVQVVDVSHGVASNAVDSAEEYIRERTHQRGIRGILRKIWHGNIARDYYRQREIGRGRAEIVETGEGDGHRESRFAYFLAREVFHDANG